MDVEDLKKAIYELTYNRVTLKSIEEELKMPANSLSGIISGSRPFPKKWIDKLEEYVKAHPIREQNIIPTTQEPSDQQREELINTRQAILPETKIVEIAEKARPSPPSGLSRAEQLRWFRENSQTLQ